MEIPESKFKLGDIVSFKPNRSFGNVYIVEARYYTESIDSSEYWSWRYHIVGDGGVKAYVPEKLLELAE